MAAEEAYIGLPADGAGKKVRALVRTVDGEAVYMEVEALVDDEGNLISPANPLTISSLDLRVKLEQLITEMKLNNMYLSIIVGEEIADSDLPD